MSALGDQVGWIAVVWLVIGLTGTAATVGTVTLAYILPQAAAAPLVGVLLDRAPRARVMAAANAAAAILFAAIALIGARPGGPGMTVLYPLIVLAGAVMPFNAAGRVAVNARSFAAIILLWALVTLAMSRVANLPEACAVMLLGGIVYSPWSALYTTALQRTTPAAFQARVAGAQSAVTMVGMPMGAFVTGLGLSVWPGRTVFVVSGLATLALAAAALRALRNLDAGTVGGR